MRRYRGNGGKGSTLPGRSARQRVGSSAVSLREAGPSRYRPSHSIIFICRGRATTPVIDDSSVFSSTPTLLEVPCVCVARRGHTLFRLRRLRRRGGSSRSVSFGQGIQARRPRRHTLRRRDIPPPGLHVGARELTMYETDAQLLTSSSLATVSNGTSRRATSSNL